MDYIYNKVKVVAGIFLLLLSLYGCKPQVPDEYIQPNQFEDILYDYHLAIAMGNQQSSGKQHTKECLYTRCTQKT